MTSATLYRVIAQNVTLRDIDTFKMGHHVRASFHRRLKTVSVYDGNVFTRM